jgi:hypothetical protein
VDDPYRRPDESNDRGVSANSCATLVSVRAWGGGSLENDDAADFIAVIAQMTSAGVVGVVVFDALLAVTASVGYIQAPEMSRAIAAATVIAILHNAELRIPST